MHVVILSWSGGENDPFTPFNAALSSYLDACGKLTRTLHLTDGDWPRQLLDLTLEGIDFVFTHQWLGTSLRLGEQGRDFWEAVNAPLICYHGDHPSHMPANHAFDGPNCAHLYSTREFCLYANRHFRKRGRAIVLDPPLFSLDLPLGDRHGDHFVLAKNLTPPPDMEDTWRQQLDGTTYGLYMAARETVVSALTQEDRVDIHPLLDDLLRSHGSGTFDPVSHPAAYHLFHSQLDFYVRNLKSVIVLESLKDVPMHIYGRGWTRYAEAKNANHRFLRGRDMAHSQSLYYSRYGILDVTPSLTGVHDRTLRAMRNETPFLSSVYLPGLLPDMDRYDPLFYRFNGPDLREKCEAIMRDPETHAERARTFSHQYQLRAHPSDFVRNLDLIARTLARP
jgi:hypothetical protein